MTLAAKRIVRAVDTPPAASEAVLRHTCGDIDSRIRAHGVAQLELKLGYRVDPAGTGRRYRVDTYLFVPKSLGIDAHTYGRERFFQDVQTFIRFKTPRLDPRILADTEHPQSPYRTLQLLLARGQRGRAARHLRLIGCMSHATLQRRTAEVLALIGSRTDDEAAARDVDQLLQEVSSVLRAFRRLQPALEPRLTEAHACVEEYLSTTTQGHLTRLYEALAEAHQPGLVTARDGVADLMAREQARHNPDPCSEQYLHRRSLLKKFVMSVLYLDARKARNAGHAQLVAALAAGVAMLFAACAAIITQRWYALNSLPFILALVGSYVLKDRIKDWVKQYGAATLGRWLWDYSVRIVDPITRRGVGRSREALRYLRQGDLPRAVRQRRITQDHNSLDADSRRESIIHYGKALVLRGSAMPPLGGGPTTCQINEIVRFNLAPFLERADHPIRTTRWFDPAHRRVESLSSPKVYHVNIVLVFRCARRAPQLVRVRVILDRDGIRRLETP